MPKLKISDSASQFMNKEARVQRSSLPKEILVCFGGIPSAEFFYNAPPTHTQRKGLVNRHLM